MKNRSIAAAAFLSGVLITGGWLIDRGASATSHGAPSGAHLFDEVLSHLRRDYVDALADSTLYRHAIDGALRELHDPHTVFLDTRRLSRLDESTTGRYAGVGIQMDVRDSGVTVIGTLPGSPAERAGLVTGDRIVTIDGRSTRGLTSDEALRTLRGAPGTSVRLQVERTGVADRMAFTLVRRTIEVNPVQHAFLVGDGIGYVTLSVFSERAAADLALAVDSLRGAGVRSLILDLRGDPGGLLGQGIDVADLFLDPPQTIVSTRGRSAEETRSFADRAPQRWATMPLVVLADSASASASEIVAGALQDHDRAVIVGTATYGKGSAQRVFRIETGGLKVTTALWYTPSGRSINRPRTSVSDALDDPRPKSDLAPPRPKFRTDAGRTVLGGGGIVPDVEVANRTLTADDKALQHALGTKVPQFRDALVEYALSLKAEHSISDPSFAVSPAMRDELFRRMQAHGITMARAVYDSSAVLVSRTLVGQVSRYVFGPTAEYQRALQDDAAFRRAVEMLHGVQSPRDLLARVPAAAH